MADVFTVHALPDTRNLRVRGVFLMIDQRPAETVQSTGDSKQVVQLQYSRPGKWRSVLYVGCTDR